MIRVRYRDSNELSPGLHAAAERHGRTTTVYLLSGLTKPQRQSALRRLRLSARMGHCPGLPAGRLALALFADRIRTGIGRAGAVLRLHPAGSTLPVMVLSGGAIAFLLFSTVSIRVLPATPAAPEAAAPEAASIPGPVPSAGAGAVPFAGSQGGVTGLGGSGNRQAIPPGLGGSSLAAGPSLTGAGPNAAPGSGDGSGQGGSGTSGSGSTSSGTSSGGSSSSSPASQALASSSSSSAPQPAPGATQPASSGVCLTVGPLGVCLKV
jgi:uncharacterized membrane protein YgcG